MIRIYCFWGLFVLLSLPIYAQVGKEADLARATEYLHQFKLKNLLDSLRLQEIKKDINNLSAKDSLLLKDKRLQAINLERDLRIQQMHKKRTLDSLKKYYKGFEVAPFGSPLLYIYTSSNNTSAEARAQRITRNLKELAEMPFFREDSLHWIYQEPNISLVYEDKLMLSITAQDLLWYTESQAVLEKKTLGHIKQTLLAYRHKHSLKRNFWEVSVGFLLFMSLVVNVLLINFLFSWLHKRIFANRRKYQGVNLGDYQLFDRRRQVIFVLFALRFVRFGLIIASVYWIATYSFSIFPATEGFSKTVWHYTLSPLRKTWNAILDYIPNIFFIVIVLILMRYFLRFVYFFVEEIERKRLVVKGFYPEWAKPTFNLFRSLCYIFIFILIFPYLPGSGSPVFQTVSAFLGLLLSLGSSSAVSNLVAGILITYMRAFKIGDRIKIGEVIGDVVEKNMLITRIKTLKDEIVTIPNANLLASNTLNFSASNPFMVHTSVTIGYNAPWRTVHELLINAAMKTEGIVAEPKPFVLQTALNDFYVAYEINAYIYKAKQMLQIYTDLHQHIQDEFNKAGVEIMSPHYRAYRDGSTSTVVQDSNEPPN